MSIRVAVRGAQCSVRRSPGTAARIRMACGGGVPLDYSLFFQLPHHSPTGFWGGGPLPLRIEGELWLLLNLIYLRLESEQKQSLSNWTPYLKL